MQRTSPGGRNRMDARLTRGRVEADLGRRGHAIVDMNVITCFVLDSFVIGAQQPCEQFA